MMEITEARTHTHLLYRWNNCWNYRCIVVVTIRLVIKQNVLRSTVEQCCTQNKGTPCGGCRSTIRKIQHCPTGQWSRVSTCDRYQMAYILRCKTIVYPSNTYLIMLITYCQKIYYQVITSCITDKPSNIMLCPMNQVFNT